MKRVLIVTPYFPPLNVPDMQRVRMSLSYFAENGWGVTVATVRDDIAGGFRDELLTATIPDNIEVIKVGAFPEHITRKVGLGSLSLRSLLHFRKAGDRILQQNKYDLVFISTSMHHVMALGRHWKKKFGIPFIVDMQDPWRNDFHLDKDSYKNSFKFRMAYNINKYMEAYTMPYVDGIMAVSHAYIDTLKQRYPSIHHIPARTISFGASLKDFELVKSRQLAPAVIDTNNGKINVLYMGAVTPFFIPVIRLFFEALMEQQEDLNQYHFYFVGTSYAQNSTRRMVYNLAEELGIAHVITEEPDRVPYFNALATLQAANILFIPGSTDKDYNASKVYNNILSGTPIFSIFHRQSSVIDAIERSGSGVANSFENLDNTDAVKKGIYEKWKNFVANRQQYITPQNRQLDFTSDKKTTEICNFFDEVVAYHKQHS